MTAADRVRGARRLLGGGAIARALAWGFAVTCTLLALIAVGSMISPAVEFDRGWSRVVAVLAGVLVALTLLWRARHLASSQQVALWIEERVPELQYALVTALEQRGSTHARGLDSHVARYDVAGVARRALRRAVLPAFAAAVLAVALLYVTSARAATGASLRVGAPGSRPNESAARASRIASLDVRVTPPRYSGASPFTLDDPSSVRALVGSSVTVRGRGDATGLEGSLDRATLRAARAQNGWAMTLQMPVRPTALTMRDLGRERIIVLDPVPDAPPRIVLTSPRRDSTLRVARGSLQVSASATDDIGLDGGQVEYLVTSGSGEVFSGRTITTPPSRFAGARTGSLSARLDLEALGLKQGDVISIRAIVRDGNSISGPGLATSDTRTIRIARADEYDSLSVDAAGPLLADSSAMSQRMLVLMTERLVREQRTLTREVLVRRSTEIAELEDRIRLRVHEALFPDEARTGAPDGPAGAAPDAHAHSESEGPGNPMLIRAYNALWEAVRSLRIAEPAPALPPMRRALAALDSARLANRLYLRGAPPKVVVDLARVRMSGKEKGSASTRTPLSPADSLRARLAVRFAEALELLPDSAGQAVRALTLLQVDGLAVAPSFGSALGDAIEAIRRGRDATLPLLRARRALYGEPIATPGLGAWSGSW